MTAGGRAVSAADYLPPRGGLPALREAAAHCEGCALYAGATQTVFGAGPKGATVVLLGEQPGDQEDRQGEPFVGPAGRLLDRAMSEAGLPREAAYVTNAVKHFKWEPRGKRRLHKKPTQAEVRACRPWLESELALIRPRVLVCLGVTAASAAFDRVVRLKDFRGTFSVSPLAAATFVTVHPSALLRVSDSGRRELDYRRFVEDLVRVRERLAGTS